MEQSVYFVLKELNCDELEILSTKNHYNGLTERIMDRKCQPRLNWEI